MRKDPAPVSLRLRWSEITSLPARIIFFIFDLYYQTIELLIIFFFKPVSMPPSSKSLESIVAYKLMNDGRRNLLQMGRSQKEKHLAKLLLSVLD